MRTPARLLGPLAAVLLAVPALAGCGGSSNADAVRSDGSVDLAKVTLVVGDQKGGSKALLSAAGELDTPYEIDWKPFTSGPPLLDAVSSGAVDLGGVGNTPPLFAIDQKKKLRAISAYDQGAYGDAIVVPRGSTVRSIADLKGKKVALAKGSSANYSLLAQLKKVGLTFDDITPVWLQPTEALAAFKGGSVDAWAIWDPFTAQAEQDAGARVVANGKGLVNGLNFQVAGDDALHDKATRAAMSDYVGRLAAAQRWAGEHKPQWSAAWAKETGLDRSVTDAAVERKTFTPRPVDGSVIATEQEMWDAFAAQKQVSGHPRLADWFSTDFNDTVARATGKAAS
ncbi:ABC transporter substrate-binding protein [Marmoricola endophyticus]|uniref:Putative aliphatic sulfonates-binding protein n=1 Tax=Marmoricola endophyticus TaxID=2040280 RepID=A0A917BLW6_9ACTN|nr:ABC transporter substrate-binding protein [Marmoricola endophyticus]GGF48662.1 ABC transporter substrate-binding protein [Marmoricola endophyticus]